MFIDDIDRMKKTLQSLNEVIGVFAMHYDGISKEHVPYFGDKMRFQCDEELFFKYCKNNNIQWKTSELYEYYVEIDGNIYFTLGDD